MKFGKYLESVRIEALSEGYIHFKQLSKEAENAMVDEAGFRADLLEELSRVNDYADMQLAKLRRQVERVSKLLELCGQMPDDDIASKIPVGNLVRCSSLGKNLGLPGGTEDADTKVGASWGENLDRTSRRQLLETYQGVFSFQQMCEVNFMGFGKVLKKRRKTVNKVMVDAARTPKSDKTNMISQPLLGQGRTRSTSAEDEGGASEVERRNSGSVRSYEDSPKPAEAVTMISIRREAFWAQHYTGAKELARNIECMFADSFTSGNLQKAQRMLRVFKRKDPSRIAFGTIGFLVGICVALTLACLLILALPAAEECPSCTEVWVGMMPVYRFTFIPILWLLLWSGLCMLWRWQDINYPFILEIDPFTELGTARGLKLAMTLLAIWYVSFVLFLFANRTGVDPLWGFRAYCFPLGLIGIFLAMLAAPKGIFYFSTRRWLAISCARTLSAPFLEVRLRENFVADVFTSMVKELVDMEYVAMLCSNRSFLHKHLQHLPDKIEHWGPPLIIITPYWFRMCQCLRRYWDSCLHSQTCGDEGTGVLRGGVGLLLMGDPLHLVNAGKYLASISVTTLSALGGFAHISGPHVQWSIFRQTWATMLVVSAVYAYAWDIFQDMGLLRFTRSEAGLLMVRVRWECQFGSPAFLAWVAISNFAGRMAWVYTIVPRQGQMGSKAASRQLLDQVTNTFFAIVEVLRRAQWTLLRIEHEYTTNPNHYRSIVEVPSALPAAVDNEDNEGCSRGMCMAVALWATLFALMAICSCLYLSGFRVPGHHSLERALPHP